MGICFVIIGALKLGGLNARSYADETTWVAAFLFLASIVVSYLALRGEDGRSWHAPIADWCFLGGVLTLTVAVLMAAILL